MRFVEEKNTTTNKEKNYGDIYLPIHCSVDLCDIDYLPGCLRNQVSRQYDQDSRCNGQDSRRYQ